MSVPMDRSVGVGVSRKVIEPSWTVNIPDIRTVKVNNISLGASERDIREFFSFSGDIQYVELQMETERTQVAYVTFEDSLGADNAILLSGATIAKRKVGVMLAENYQPPVQLIPQKLDREPLVKKTEEAVSTVLAKGFVMGKDAVSRAKAFDEQHRWSSNASAAVSSIDNRMGLSERLSMGTSVVNGKVREMDERFGVVDKTKSAYAVAEKTVFSARSVIMGNRYTSWVANAVSTVAKAAEDVSIMTKDKVERAELEKEVSLYGERMGVVNNFAQMEFDESLKGQSAVSYADDFRLEIV